MADLDIRVKQKEKKVGIRRVLRGGSWYNGQGSARCAVRNWYFAGNRDDAGGFRVAKETLGIVVRGGLWIDIPDFLRSAVRIGLELD